MSLDLHYEPEVLVPDITVLSEKEWQRYRRMGIGGSDAAAACGLSPWKTARDVYREKTGEADGRQEEDNWVAKEIGKRLEELVIQIFKKRTGLKPYAVRKMFRHPFYPFMLADVDYFVEINGDVYAVECKTTFSFRMDEWEDGGIPRHYEMQGRHYMAVTNVKGIIFLCLYGNSESTFLMRRLKRDLKQEEELIEQEEWFWDCVSERKPPAYTEQAPLVLKSIREQFEIRENGQMNLPQELAPNVREYLKLKERKAELDIQSKQIEEQLKHSYAPIQEAMKGAEKGLIVLDGKRYTAGYTKRSTTSIGKAEMQTMRLMCPEVYEAYAKTKVSHSFYIKQEKAG